MSNFSINDIFQKLLEDENFREKYILSFLDRFVYKATDLEKGLTTEQRKIAISSLLEAYQYLVSSEDEKLSPVDISNVGDCVNKESGIEGFRKIEVSAGKFAEWEPVLSRSIYFSIYSLLDNYYNVWNDRDIYEKEAAFHITLMRIHPFEDGNKRVAKILMNANFVKQNHPPVVITEGDTELYYKFINDQDIEGFAKFLKERSLQELNILISYYKIAYDIPITDSILDVLGFADITGGRK